MRKLFFLLVIGAAAVGAYNYSQDRDIFSLPRASARALRDTVRDTVKGTVRDTVRETKVEVGDHAKASVHAAVNRTEAVVTEAALTSKIKAKMALDDVVKAGDIDVDTEGSVVTLTGNVESKDEQKRAMRIAEETAGVTKVVNRLRVR